MLGNPLRGSENARASIMYFLCKRCQSFLLCILTFSMKQYTGFKYTHCAITHSIFPVKVSQKYPDKKTYICECFLVNMLQH